MNEEAPRVAEAHGVRDGPDAFEHAAAFFERRDLECDERPERVHLPACDITTGMIGK